MEDKTIWKMFAKHHYLSHTHNNAANVFIALINNEIEHFKNNYWKYYSYFFIFYLISFTYH